MLGVAAVLPFTCGTAIAQESDEVDDLRQAFATAYRGGDWEQAVVDYEAAHYAVKLRVLPGTGHAFPRNTNRELGKALRFVLGE